MMEIDVRLAQLPLINLDYEKIREQLEAEVKKYDIVVTVDTVAGAKEVATKLNKVAGSIDDKRKAMVAEASAPIKAFDARMKELVELCKDGRQKILDQVVVFEDRVRERCRFLLNEERQRLYILHRVREEFQQVDIGPMVKLSNVTEKGGLAAAGKRELEQQVLLQRDIQHTVDERLNALPVRCIESGLLAPLQRVHVDSFLFADPEVYESRLVALINVELERQSRTAQTVQQRAKPETVVVPRAVTSGKKRWIVTATFDVEVSDKLSAIDIEQQLHDRLIEEFSSLAGVKAVPV
jgi:hypothetical protein